MKKSNEEERKQQVTTTSTTSSMEEKEKVVEKQQQPAEAEEAKEAKEEPKAEEPKVAETKEAAETSAQEPKQTEEVTPKKKGNVLGVAAIIAVLLVCAVVAVILRQPSKKGKPETETAEQVTQAATQTEEEEVATETEVVEETPALSLDDWVTTLNYDECKYCLWNKKEGSGQVLENGKYYEMTEDDEIVLYCNEPLSTTSFPEEIEILDADVTHERYNIFNFAFDNVIRYTSSCEALSGNIYDFDFTLISPFKEETKSLEEMTGQEWADSLVEATPHFIVWNDTTGVKKEIANGETYQMQEGDELAVYHGYYYNMDEVLPQGNITGYQNYSTLFFLMGDTTEIKVTLSNMYDTSDVVELNCTLIPF